MRINDFYWKQLHYTLKKKLNRLCTIKILYELFNIYQNETKKSKLILKINGNPYLYPHYNINRSPIILKWENGIVKTWVSVNSHDRLHLMKSIQYYGKREDEESTCFNSYLQFLIHIYIMYDAIEAKTLHLRKKSNKFSLFNNEVEYDIDDSLKIMCRKDNKKLLYDYFFRKELTSHRLILKEYENVGSKV